MEHCQRSSKRLIHNSSSDTYVSFIHGTREALERAIFLLSQSKEEAPGIDADRFIRLVTQFYEAFLADEGSLSDDDFPSITLQPSP